MKVLKYKDAEETCSQLAAYIQDRITVATTKHKQFFLCLSGGNTPKLLYEKLADKIIDWSNVHIFFGDERVVPFESEQNNARMATIALLSKIKIPKQNIHPIITELQVNEAVDNYEQELRKIFVNPDHTFDMVLAGLGDDGHTLSLFPGASIEKNKWVQLTKKTGEAIFRITLTPSIINASAEVIFLVTGNNKAEMVKNVAVDKNQACPASLIQPLSKNMSWFVDEQAGKYL
ncbi:6-phosphogluconolactonase [soil metagenome]